MQLAASAESSENDQIDEEEYEPTQQEIYGYAEFLGMTLPDDADLLYIAEEGVSFSSCLKFLKVKSTCARALESLQQRQRRNLLL